MLALIRRATYNMPTNNDIADVIYDWYANLTLDSVIRYISHYEAIPNLDISYIKISQDDRYRCHLYRDGKICDSDDNVRVVVSHTSWSTDYRRLRCQRHFIEQYGYLPNFKYSRHNKI